MCKGSNDNGDVIWACDNSKKAKKKLKSELTCRNVFIPRKK